MVEKMEWLNSQEERCCMMLKENARRKKSFENELTAIRELKKMRRSKRKFVVKFHRWMYL